ncbi:MAG: DUF4430 domain-containing protein [Clostridiaceae bacterium]|nr:DUF4430 domain-containing protein [Clostridiaceae bacterium]
MKKTTRFLGLLCAALLIFLLASCAARPEEAGAESVPEETSGAAEDGSGETVASPSCTLIIRCDTLLGKLEELPDGKAELVPADGLLLEATNVAFSEGESVFDVLKRELQARRMHLEFSENPLYDTAYIDGICNLYEYDCGELSGWIYRVNGETPGYGCSQYLLSDGDVIEWLYTCDLGNDL